jgi:hypothetical protein
MDTRAARPLGGCIIGQTTHKERGARHLARQSTRHLRAPVKSVPAIVNFARCVRRVPTPS